uniref:Uncharacterized protein n=1 Tax=Oryza brachyantha TaxID=4533 RepID=J3LY21_ORYBR
MWHFMRFQIKWCPSAVHSSADASCIQDRLNKEFSKSGMWNDQRAMCTNISSSRYGFRLVSCIKSLRFELFCRISYSELAMQYYASF